MISFQTKIVRILRSPQFFAAVLLLFFIESIWIAVSAAYPGVFDENAHFAVIQLYSHQLSPFFPTHAPYIDTFGAVSRDPSFLYHYLMSFPYRLIAAVTADQTMQIIDLRFINILLFGGGLILFRRLLFKTRVSPAIIHSVLLFFVLVPVVPLLAAQINYDNLVMLITPAALLIAVTINDRLRRGQLPVARTMELLTLCLLGSLVQFEFLPIFAAIMLWLGWRIVRTARAQPIAWRPLLSRSWRITSWKYKVLVSVPLAVAVGLFLKTYAVNLVDYHTLTPACNQVLSVKQCDTDANWLRDQTALAGKTSVNGNPLIFAGGWTYRMFVAMFYTNSGGASWYANYVSVNPLPLIFITALAVFAAGAVLVIKYQRVIFRDYDYLGLLFFVAVLYVGILLLHNYLEYLHLGQKFAINGRYLFPIALPCMVMIALAFRQLLLNRAQLKVALLVGVFLLFLQGGGALTYIIDSKPDWYWHDGVAPTINKAAQQAIEPFIIIKSPMHSIG